MLAGSEVLLIVSSQTVQILHDSKLAAKEEMLCTLANPGERSTERYHQQRRTQFLWFLLVSHQQTQNQSENNLFFTFCICSRATEL